MDALKNLLATIADFIKRLNATSLKRIFIYVALIYPLVFTVYYKDEVAFLLTKSDKQVKVRKLDDAMKRCYDLRRKYSAEAVIMYVYQPAGQSKTSMERICVSTGAMFKPLDENAQIQLLSRTHEIEDIRLHNYVKITKMSDHALSSLLVAYNLDEAYIVPIRDENKQIIGEIAFVFAEARNEQLVLTLINEAQLFMYDIK